MATNSPMSNFNRKNPYVIQAKHKYGELMNQYESISKNLIVYSIIFVVATTLFWILNWSLENHFEYSRIIYVLLGISILYVIRAYLYIKNTIKDPVNNKIDQMITLESNEILNISIEFVQELIYDIQSTIGSTKNETRAFKIDLIILLTIQTILTLFNIV